MIAQPIFIKIELIGDIFAKLITYGKDTLDVSDEIATFIKIFF